ncbi:MAG: DAK2 domain-containing protein, partial [Calditerricola sp.]|nr:DAK2 domain-containing protein [Calditerricola sp.]
MAETALKRLRDHAPEINALNVFPVPDGDTGINMTLTLEAGVAELRRAAEAHLGRALQAFARGLLMGARGNSGVILSQLFRGFAQACCDRAVLDGSGLAKALEAGVHTAYQAVLEPAEGTVLTVARLAAARATAIAQR